ncbi:MAG: YIP1 family protein [Clostridia bacterium]|nr:YIP1 family protein [Clostridia bacterium]
MGENEETKLQEGVENKAEEKAESAAENKTTEKVEENKAEEKKEKKEENQEKQAEVKKKEKKEKKPINALKIFYKPEEAVKTAVKNNYWKSGLIFLFIYFLIVGMVSTLQFVQVKLSGYDFSIKYAQERLDKAKENYRERQTTYNRLQVEKYEETLNEVRKSKWENFADFEFYLSMGGKFVTSAVTAFIRILLLIALLYAIGKLMKGQGKFSQVVAGVGVSVNIYYISLILLPLLAKIPFLSSVSVLGSVVSALFLVLIYFAFKNTFELDEDRSVIGAVLAMAIMVLIIAFVSDGFTFVSDVVKKVVDQF